MLSDKEKASLANRLHRLAGQVSGVERMMEENASCVEILIQIAAASGALNKVGHLILENHIKSCVSEAMRSGSNKLRDQKLDEIIQLFRKYTRVVD